MFVNCKQFFLSFRLLSNSSEQKDAGLINYVKLITNLLCKQSPHYPPRVALAIFRANVIVCVLFRANVIVCVLCKISQ